jgi:hypothetical protein
MKTLTKWILAALAPVAMVGCDPFEEAVTGPPVVISTGFTDTAGPTPYLGTAAGSAWTIPGIASTCVGPGQAEVVGFIWVKFNKLLNGESVQTSPNASNPQLDCTPTGSPATPWLTVAPAPPALGAWYSCYSPQSPSPDEGASVIIFLAPDAPPASGWATASPIPASGDVATSVQATGTVSDKEGQTVSINATAQIDPDPGVPGTPVLTPTAGQVVATWTAADCAIAGTTRYVVERAPDVAGAPGTYVNATGSPTTALTLTETGLTAGTYWYRVTAETSAPGNFLGAPSTAVSVVVP